MEIEIVCDDGQWLVDSRVLATRLGYDHTTIARSIKRHKDRLEGKSALRQFVQVLKHENYQGSTRQVYWMLNERRRNVGQRPENHFVDVNKMIKAGCQSEDQDTLVRY